MSKQPEDVRKESVQEHILLEREKARLSLRHVIIEKLFIAGIIAVIGGFVTCSIDKQKNLLDQQLQNHKAILDEQARIHAQQLNLQMETMKGQQDSSRTHMQELLRTEGEKDLQLLQSIYDSEAERRRTDLDFQGTLAVERFRGYQNIYRAVTEFATFFDTLLLSIPSERQLLRTHRDGIQAAFIRFHQSSGPYYVFLEPDILHLMQHYDGLGYEIAHKPYDVIVQYRWDLTEKLLNPIRKRAFEKVSPLTVRGH